MGPKQGPHLHCLFTITGVTFIGAAMVVVKDESVEPGHSLRENEDIHA